MINEREESKISQLIKYRESELANTQIYHNYSNSEHLVELPVIPLPKPVEILFNSPSLWLKVGDHEYTPSLLVKSFFVRKDGGEIDRHVFSVFIADNKRSIAKKWGVSPHSARNKQRYQYWDRDFVKALFTYTTLCEKSHSGLINKISYTIRENITFEEMEAWYSRANSEVLNKYERRR